jgi:hypothetical protein
MVEESSDRSEATLEAYTQPGTRWQNANWGFVIKPHGKATEEQINQALLMDIRSLLRSIRSMAVFFTVLAVIGLVLGFIGGLIAGLKH